MTKNKNNQEEFDRLFLEKNLEINKDIEEVWNDILFSDYMKSIYKKETEIYKGKIGKIEFDLYMGDSQRYVLQFICYEENNDLEGYDVFQIWTDNYTLTYEHHYIQYGVYDSNTVMDFLPDNESKIRYIEEKINFLKWSKNCGESFISQIQEHVFSKKINEDIKRLKSLNW